MHPRLPWQHNPAGGFIAYPEGEQFKDRVVTLREDKTSSIPWHWWISYDAAKRSDHAHTKQTAADAATAAWPLMKARAAELARIAAEAEALRTMVQRMMQKGDLPLSVFGIETADSAKLVRIMDIVKTEGGLGGPAKGLVEACSVELGRRRRGG